jgi:hypothetical protein
MDDHIEMPGAGPRWHQLRSVNEPKLPSCRTKELENLIQAMTHPDETYRPSADQILSVENVKTAGRGLDTFLHDYIQDVEEFERQMEQKMNAGYGEDQTPRQHHRDTVRSPSLSMLLPQQPNLMTPPVKYNMN